jgi:hypothetical protein
MPGMRILTLTLRLAFTMAVVLSLLAGTPAAVPTLTVTPASAPAAQPSPRPTATSRWHGCTVTYRVTAHGHSQRHLKAAIRDVEAATGLDFRRAGAATATADLRIELSPQRAPRHLRRQGKGNYGLAQWRIADKNKITTAKITIFRDVYSTPAATQRNVYRHEVGHVLGLPHQKSTSRDVMNPRISSTRTTTTYHRLLQSRYRHCR